MHEVEGVATGKPTPSDLRREDGTVSESDVREARTPIWMGGCTGTRVAWGTALLRRLGVQVPLGAESLPCDAEDHDLPVEASLRLRFAATSWSPIL